jgi:hypothetical protein
MINVQDRTALLPHHRAATASRPSEPDTRTATPLPEDVHHQGVSPANPGLPRSFATFRTPPGRTPPPPPGRWTSRQCAHPYRSRWKIFRIVWSGCTSDRARSQLSSTV